MKKLFAGFSLALILTLVLTTVVLACSPKVSGSANCDGYSFSINADGATVLETTGAQSGAWSDGQTSATFTVKFKLTNGKTTTISKTVSKPNNCDHKVWICHVPPGNPENANPIEVDANGWNGHDNHDGDFVISGPNDPNCPPKPPLCTEKVAVEGSPSGWVVNPNNFAEETRTVPITYYDKYVTDHVCGTSERVEVRTRQTCVTTTAEVAGEWSVWSVVDANGMQSRSRVWTAYDAIDNTTVCSTRTETQSQYVSCSMTSEGEPGPWSDWVSNGDGTETRTREIPILDASGGGSCGSRTETETRNTPQVCEWNPELPAGDPECKPPACEWDPEILASDPNCKPPEEPKCKWNPALLADDPKCVKPKPPYEAPRPPEIPACQPCGGENSISRQDLLPKDNEVKVFYTLTVKCDTSGFDSSKLMSNFWMWVERLKGYTLRGWHDLGLEECDLAHNQWVEVLARGRQISVLIGNTWYPLRQSDSGLYGVTIAPVPGMDSIILVDGFHEGTFKAEDWKAQGMQTAYAAGMKVLNISACGGFLYTDLDVGPDMVVIEKQGSNSSQLVAYLMEDRGYTYEEALPLSLTLVKEGKVTLPK